MKQVVFKRGQALCVDVPSPSVPPRHLLVEVRASCISPGTEIAGLTGSGKTLWQKARENPDKLRHAIARMKTNGVWSVVEEARARQEDETPCGYSAAGIVRRLGDDTRGFAEGQRVAIAGAGYANHAEWAAVPIHLATSLPDSVPFETACSCALGAVAMQGVRRAEVAIGDFVAVIGCGAIGLLTVQMLRAAGCRVFGLDLDERRLALAKQLGAEQVFNSRVEDTTTRVVQATQGQGADRVILTVSTGSSDPIQQAFQMSRRKGRVVLVGVADLSLDREAMYRKELDFVISTSYGPGRYDDTYERKGLDYPYAYVRWTEQRNLQAYIQLLAQGAVRVEPLIEEVFPVDRAAEAYDALRSDRKPLLVLLSYPKSEMSESAPEVSVGPPMLSVLPCESKGRASRPGMVPEWSAPSADPLRVGLVGVGSFVQTMHIPNLRRRPDLFVVRAICDQNGLACRKAAKLFRGEAPRIETDFDRLLASDIDLVLIGTRHDSHANLSVRALEAGKAVFVEKPMCITHTEFDRIKQTLQRTAAPYMVGYNRRFSPAARRIHARVERRVNPLMIHYTMNAGYVPYEAWVHTEEGGGRIIGEACHIFDLFRYLTNAAVESVSVDGLHSARGGARSSDNAVITLKYADGSVATLLYTALGHPSAPKERMEVFSDGQLFVIEDYVRLVAHGVPLVWAARRADKGHSAELEFLARAVRQDIRFPIPWEELAETWKISRYAADLLTD